MQIQDNTTLIEEYHSLKNFIDKYRFYQEHSKELREIEPLNPLMIEYIEASKLFDKNDKRIREGKDGAIYYTMDDSYKDAQSRKLNAYDAISQYYKDNDLEEPKPRNDVEGGQVIEFRVNQYPQKLSFEDKKTVFLLSVEGKNYADEIASKHIELTNTELSKIRWYDHLSISLSANYEINFTKIYEILELDKQVSTSKNSIEASLRPTSIDYKSLAKAIPLLQFKKFLEDFLIQQTPQPIENQLSDKPSHQEEEEKSKADEKILDEVTGLPCIEFDNLFGNDIKAKNEIWHYMQLLKMIDANGKYLMGNNKTFILSFIIVMRKYFKIPNQRNTPLTDIFTLKIFGKIKRINKSILEDEKQIEGFLNGNQA